MASISKITIPDGSSYDLKAKYDIDGNEIKTTYIKNAQKGAASGVAELDENGLVPTSQLPSYVDDVLEYNSKSDFPATGETGKIYVDKATNLTYRWSGSSYVEISPSLALGTTSSTAFRGDYGNTAYTHATDSAKISSAQTSGLYKISVTGEGHVGSVDAVTKNDITGLGIPGSDTNTTYTFTDGTNGFTVTPSDGSSQTVHVTPSMTILSYGKSTWADFLAAYKANNVIYCRASSNSNPASGSQTRLAFMAYVNNAESPTEVEFQYYRSVASHSDSQQGDQVYVYKITSQGYWSYIYRSTFTRVASSTGLSSTWSNNTWTAKANLVSDTALTNAATAATEVSGRVYPVAVDKDGKLAVNVPWENTTYTAASATPIMDGTAAVGTSSKYAREDHVHPSDTSRVPTTRTVNNKALSSDISLTASDVDAVPTTRTVNNKALSSDISLTASDVSAIASSEIGKLIPYGYCEASRVDVAKNVTVSPEISELVEGLAILVKFKEDNNATNPTLNVNNLGAVAIKRYGTTAAGSPTTASWHDGSVVMLTYDGTYWQLTDWLNTTYSGATITPKMDGTAAVGTSSKYAREDHVHPSDTSRVPTTRKVNNKALSSDISLTASDVSAVPTTRKVNDKALSSDISLTASDVSAIPISQKGAASGVAELDANGLVPTSQLPSYVDDVLEYNSKSAFPTTGETGKIYVDASTNLTYRWSGTAYVEISPSLALGTTSSTAFRGDYGNTAYAHATDSAKISSSKTSGLYKIAVTGEGHVASVDAVTKTDITGLGIPGSVPTSTSELTNDSGFITSANVPNPASSNPAMDGTAAVGTSSKYAREDHVHPSDTSRVPTTRKVNNKALSSDITLSASDVSAIASSEIGKLIPYGYCETSRTAVAKTVTVVPSVTELVAGLAILVKFKEDNNATNPTLNVNNLGAVPIKRYGTTAAGSPTILSWHDGSVVMLTYDGTYWQLTNWLNTTYTASTAIPLMNGVGGAGSSSSYSRGDHVHPSDTSRVPTTRTINGKALSSNISLTASDVSAVPTTRTVNNKALSSDITLSASDVSAIPISQKGAVSGVAELDENGLVPTSQLPSYVDDVLEYSARSSFPTTGETGKIYVDTSTNLTYRWSGTTYVEISPSLALGTTSSTAFRGDYGNSAYAHAVTNKGSAFTSGLYKITTNAEGHVTAATAVQKADITALGIPGSDTDTKVTNTLATTTKFYITGTVSDTTNTGTQNFDTGIYATTTAGELNATQYKLNEKVQIKWNDTDKCIDFVFV